LEIDPRVAMFDEPTRGVDIGAKSEIHSLIADLARSGTAVLLVTSELPELMGLAHRIIVLNEGRAVAEFERDEFNAQKIIAPAASGIVGTEGEGSET
jgi:ABC-type sugar transport system ATPase subunit